MDKVSEETENLQEIKKCFIDLLGVEKVRQLVKRALSKEMQPEKILNAMKEGLGKVGRKYDSGEYFLSDLIMSGIMAMELANLIKPALSSSSTRRRGKVVIGTVKGDIHNIGKNLLITMLSSQGFDIIDIGVDVPPEKFIRKVKQHRPDILAMSCLLTMGLSQIERTVELIKKNSLDVKIMIGGRPISQEFANRLGVEYGKDAFEAFKVASRLVESD